MKQSTKKDIKGPSAARADKMWFVETPTKRALGDEKRYAQHNEIKEITFWGETVRDNEKIREAFVDNYNMLFVKNVPMGEGFSSEILSFMPKLDEQERESLEAPITVGEIEKAIDDLSSGKTLGPDGLNAEFYKVFKTEVSFFLKQVFDEAYEKHVLPVSFKQSHGILIPKYEEAVKLLSVKSYRPISLTNVEYKIYMNVLASRLRSVIQKLVGPHQTCGIKGRTICTNTHVARSTLECCDAFDSHVAMLQLDLEKAFDSVA